MTFRSGLVRAMEEKENQILKTLLSDLHKIVTSPTDINDSNFELPSTVKPGTRVAKQYRQALEIYRKFKEIKRQIQRLEDENATVKENLKIQNDTNTFIDAKWKSDRDLLQSSLARLSRLAGDMLKHENTNLTDLSDVDRPMKLSEAYSELYDNEWTDAFEELTGHGLTDNDAVAKLLDMLMVTYHKCGQITWERYRTLKSIVSTIDIVHVHPSVVAYSDTKVQGYDETLPPSDGQATEVRNGREVNNPNVYTIHASKETELVYNRNKDVGCSPQTNEEHLTSQMTLSTEQEREIKDIWRTTTKAIKQDAVKHLYKVLLTRFDTPIKDLVSTSKYLTSCIDICWKMVVQEKPMYLDIVAQKNGGSGMIFDLDKFRAYTMSGERVDFVVWPALFLHEGGPILVKGIAQGCNKSGS